jgi:hypothetical protein
MLRVKDLSIMHPDGTLEILNSDALERGRTANTQNAFDHYLDRIKSMDYSDGIKSRKEHSEILDECFCTYNLLYDEAKHFQILAVWHWNAVKEELERRSKHRSRQSPLS